MDILKKTATAFDELLSVTYYFEIAKKQKLYKFILSFEKSDFYHLVGLHKLTDIAALQGEPNKGKVFDNILKGNITYDLIKHSRFFSNMNSRLELFGSIENILDSNQIIFKYISSKHQNSFIEANFLLEKAYETNIVFMFLSERSKAEKSNIPHMCCRSFFPMEHFDYTRNQPTYTLLKKMKIDVKMNTKTLQYDRSEIIEKIRVIQSESERKSIMLQLNENKAQIEINKVLADKNRNQKEKHEHDQF